ncbi:MAG: methyltransferase domain-containing protein [Rhodobacteraceae bacterium]|jgi:SAM-dependent methyltransferase|nr:methyltransferase domain-containing protein [Paracoccaceae bacterium]
MFKLFGELDRLGPGNAESLRWALGLAGIRTDARILDAGCGTGADLGTLCAAVPKGRVVALDQAGPFIDRVKARFPRVEALVGEMTVPSGGPFDLIWSAGAVYSVGVGAALRAWRAHLAPGGRVAFSDLRLRVANPPPEVVRFFAAEGVALGSVEALQAEVEAEGYRILGARWVGPAGWASYYGPLESQLDGFQGDADMVATLRAEIALWRTHGVTYGYRLMVVEPV